MFLAGKSVWLISEGYYSDYDVLAVALTEQEAWETYNFYMENSEKSKWLNEPQEVPLVEAMDHKLYFLLRISEDIPIDSQCRFEETESIHEYREIDGVEPNYYARTLPECHVVRRLTGYWARKEDSIRLSVEGTDFERVRKVFREQRFMIAAEPRIVFESILAEEQERKNVNLPRTTDS